MADLPSRFAVKTEPGVEPVSVAELKSHARVDISTDDTLIGTYITAARRHIEALTGRRLINTVLYLYLDAYPAGRRLHLRTAPVSAVAAVLTYDADGASEAMSSADYLLDAVSPRPALVLKTDASWPADPAAGLQAANAVRVEFTAGYGAAATAVPADLVLAVKLLAAYFYEQREAIQALPAGMTLRELPIGIERLIAPYRLWEELL